MGAFNILITNIRCANCNNHYEAKIQFKYGDTWQFEYRLGDKLLWGGNDIGKSDTSNVKVYGILENDHCPLCKEENLNDEFDIIVQDDKIMGIQPLEDIRIYNDAGGNYCVCK